MGPRGVPNEGDVRRIAIVHFGILHHPHNRIGDIFDHSGDVRLGEISIVGHEDNVPRGGEAAG